MQPDLSFVVIGLIGAAFALAHVPDDHESCRAQHAIEVAKEHEAEARANHEAYHEDPVKTCPWCPK